VSSKKINKCVGRIVESILPGIVRFIAIEPTNSIRKEVRFLVEEEKQGQIRPEDLADIKVQIYKNVGFLPFIIIEEYEPEFCRA
jgi:hypothetical protein